MQKEKELYIAQITELLEKGNYAAIGQLIFPIIEMVLKKATTDGKLEIDNHTNSEEKVFKIDQVLEKLMGEKLTIFEALRVDLTQLMKKICKGF